MQFVGVFNVYNLLAVYGAGILLGLYPDDVLRVLSLLKSVAGRFQTISSPPQKLQQLLTMPIHLMHFLMYWMQYMECSTKRDG